MKKILAGLVLLVATLGFSSSASAIVVSGSSYVFYLQGSGSGSAFAAETIFDDATAYTTRDGILLSVSESDASLGGLNHRIIVSIGADGDLFPMFGETAYFGIGTFGDVIDLESPATLYDARLTLLDSDGVVRFASENLASLASLASPWDGSMPSIDASLEVPNMGGLNISSVIFEFYVSDIPETAVPEPDGLLLFGIGLFALGFAYRSRLLKS
ncbi:PEP-CTERM sorting domain-containing protein [Massilia sp. DWR3-1-1]|uniref:PEP-CTERM sorting domain-containing protein n=1 Tax=Massilia sp. DWR3-1-1 TaxID=2804559 RepID=UPI003CF480DB